MCSDSDSSEATSPYPESLSSYEETFPDSDMASLSDVAETPPSPNTTKSTIYDEFNKAMEQITSEDEFSRAREQITSEDEFSRAREQITSEGKGFAKRLLCSIKETADIELGGSGLEEKEQFLKALLDVRKDDILILLKLLEVQLKGDAMEFLPMMNTIEKPSEQMAVNFVDHEMSSTFKKYLYSLYKKLPHQEVLELSRTDDGPLDQNKMLTDGHQDSERIAHLFDMLISLAPSIILPQQSEMILSHVKLSDILLSLVDQFSEVCVQYTWDMHLLVWYDIGMVFIESIKAQKGQL